MKKIFIISVMLALTGWMRADNLIIGDINLTIGEEKQVAIEMENTEKAYAAFQFDLKLPEGVAIALKSNGKPNASLVEDRIEDHSLTVERLSSGKYRFLTFSMTNSEFYGTSGPIVNIVLTTEDGATVGTGTATISSQVFSDKDGIQFFWSDTSFDVELAAPVIPQVIADDRSRLYGDDNPEFTYSVTDGEIEGVPELTTEATVLSPVGEYVIAVGAGTIVGEFVPVNGTLTVTRAPLTISGGTYTMVQGEELPTFVASYSGFKNNETEDVLIAKPIFTTTATSDSEPGTYDVVVAGAEAQNYNITYVNGTLTITFADGISELDNDSQENSIYTLDGQKLNYKGTIDRLPAGVYIINGKKKVVK